MEPVLDPELVGPDEEPKLVAEDDAELVDGTDEPDVDEPGLVTPELVEPVLVVADVEPELVGPEVDAELVRPELVEPALDPELVGPDDEPEVVADEDELDSSKVVVSSVVEAAETRKFLIANCVKYFQH